MARNRKHSWRDVLAGVDRGDVKVHRLSDFADGIVHPPMGVAVIADGREAIQCEKCGGKFTAGPGWDGKPTSARLNYSDHWMLWHWRAPKRRGDNADYFKALRAEGFRRVDVTTSHRKLECAIYEKTVGKLCLGVQLWANADDFSSRAYHYYNGIGTTVPTGFSSVKGMLKAITFEAHRRNLGAHRNEGRHFS